MEQQQRGVTVWLTGLSGAGKTTIAILFEIRTRGTRERCL